MAKKYEPTYYSGVEEEIYRGRRRVLVHSIMYYHLDQSILPDNEFDAMAYGLAKLQEDNPEASENVEYHLEAFQEFKGSDCFGLPLWDPRARKVALHLLNTHGKVKV